MAEQSEAIMKKYHCMQADVTAGQYLTWSSAQIQTAGLKFDETLFTIHTGGN